MSPAEQRSADRVVRSLVLRCADWPLVAAGASPDEASVVIGGGRVVVASPAARAEGIEPGHRRREAQRRCPSVVVHHPDPDRDARLFSAIGGALEHITPRIELSVPGIAAFPTRGPSRYFGGDHALAIQVMNAVSGVMVGLGWPDSVGIGVADGRFVAEQVARSGGVTVLEPGASAAFLAPLPVGVLGRLELCDVLRRLGIGTLGAFAALPAADVVARFGADGLIAHRIAGGLDERPPHTAPPPPHLTVSIELDPPVERVDQAAFVAKGLAERLHSGLEAEGLACTRLCITAETDTGACNERLWRHEGALGVGAIIERVRWQLDGWLNGPTLLRPTSGVSRLTLIPDEVGPARGRQLGFWGGETAADERAMRALARVQGIVGVAAVTVPEVRGGRSPIEQIVRVPVATVELTASRSALSGNGRELLTAPWPGRVPTPTPALVLPEPLPALVCDQRGSVVAVSGRGALSAAPATLGEQNVAGGAGGATGAFPITAWAGPWLTDERWWDPIAHVRRARLQLLLADGRAVLVCCEHGQWSIEGWYD